MKPFFQVLLPGLLLLLMGHTTRAQVVRVTNGQSLSALIASATAGTTFIVEPGSYGDLTLTKRVAIIGPGYFLGSSQQATTGSATFGRVSFKAGSENSILMSCAVNDYIYVGASQVTVSRCLAGNIRVGYDGANDVNVSNVIVKQCFVQNSIYAYSNGTVACSIRSNIVRTGIQCSYNFQGEVINNTTVGYDSPPTSYGLYFPSLSPTAYVIAKNNITTYAQHVTQNTNLIYNIVYYNQSGLPTSNLVNKPIATIFVGNNATSLEGQYMLSANSPAKGAGEGGVDCGAFGGDEPYIIGGVPSGPIIQELTVPQVTSGSTINVRVKARVQN